MVSIRPLISNSSSPLFSKLLRTVPSPLITFSITVSFMFHGFLSFLARSKYLSLFSVSFIFTPFSARTTILFSFFFFCFCFLLFFSNYYEFCFFLIGIMQSVFISKCREFYVSFSRKYSGFYIYPFVIWYNYYLLIRVFHISVSWWSFTRVWVRASLLKSPGLFSVFWPFLIRL